MSYFEWYGLPIAVELDKSDLRKRFYLKSREVHPDHQSDAEMQAAINNEAFRILSDDDTRLKHILDLHHVTSLDQEPLPKSFLLQMMELNEAIDEAESPDQVEALRQDVEKWERELDEILTPYRNQWPDNQESQNAALAALKDFVIKRKYLLRIKENLSKFAPS